MPAPLTPQSEPHHYTAMVEDQAGQRSWLTLQINGRDAQGAFDWHCSQQGLTRLDDLEEGMDEPLGDTTEPFKRMKKHS